MHSFDQSDLMEEEEEEGNPLPRLVPQLLDTYCKLLRHDPVTFRAVESLLCSVSYMATSRFSNEVTELFFMSSNLLHYANDRILAKSRRSSDSEQEECLEADKDKLEQMLHVLECVEVFVEISAQRLGGARLKWLIVFVIAAVKSSIRLCLLYQHNRVLIGSVGSSSSDAPTGWVGSRTGIFFKQSHPKSLLSHHVPNKDLILAELCYTMKPVLHLMSMGFLSSKSWVPYILALGLDLFSLKTLQKFEHPTDRQTVELTRRKTSLLFYLFRSPCYNEITEQRLMSVVKYLNNIPVVSLLTDGVAEYLPEWQKIYYYVWGP